jgi:hypothetical protein
MSDEGVNSVEGRGGGMGVDPAIRKTERERER